MLYTDIGNLTKKQNLGELKIVVLFEVDAYIGDPTEADRLAANDDPNLVSSFEGLSLSNPSKTVLVLKIYHSGPSQAPDSSTLAKITTCSKGQIGRKEIYPQLYLSGIPHWIIAHCKDGTFTRVEKRNLLTSFSDEEKRGRDENLTRLAIFLRSIKEITMKRSDGEMVSLVYDGQNKDVTKIYQPL